MSRRQQGARDSRRSPGGAVAAHFLPTQLSGCVLWLRADLGITLNGSNVSAWADQSGAGNNATQSTGANQPGYSASVGINGLASLTFNGSSQRMVFGGTAASALLGACSLYIVCQPNTSTARDVLSQPTSTFGALFQVYPDVDGTNARFDTPGSTTVGGAALGAACMLSLLMGAAAGSQTLRRNTTTVTNTRGSPGTALSTANIGATQTGASTFLEWFNGQAGEIIIYNVTRDAPTDLQVRTYLQGMWGVTCTP